jgi:hypothetical protein
MYTDDYIISINNSRIFTIVLASISALFPLSVVFILIQRYNTLVRGKSLIHYILMISIADTMTAIFIAVGYPLSGSVACTIQAFCRNYFARMSWFYTDVLIFQLFYVVVFKSYFLTKRYMHAIVFTLNIVLSLVPLSTGTSYGQDDDDQGIPLTACALSNGKGNYEDILLWVFSTFLVELYISFIFIIFLSAIVVVYSLTVKSTKSSNIYMNERMKDSWKIIILYPIAMMIAWVPGVAYAFYYNSYPNNHQGEAPPNGLIIGDYLQAINVLYGPLLSLIFYTKTIDARRAWIHNLRCILYLVMNVDIDDRESCSSIISIEDVRITEYSSSKVSRSISRLTNLTSSLWSRKPSSLSTPIINSEHQVNPMSNETIVRIEENL